MKGLIKQFLLMNFGYEENELVNKLNKIIEDAQIDDYQMGYQDGFSSGYDEGYSDGEDSNSQN